MRYLQYGLDFIVTADTRPSGPLVGDNLVQVSESDPATVGWTYDPVEQTFEPPAEPEPVDEPNRVPRIDFVRLFASIERQRINALRKDIAALTATDYADPTKGLLVALEDVLFMFDLPAEFIELDHADTIAAVGLLAYAGVFGVDPEDRVAAFLAGQMPE